MKFTKGLRGGLGTRVDRWGQLLWPQSTPVHGFFSRSFLCSNMSFGFGWESASVNSQSLRNKWLLALFGQVTVKLVLRLDVYDSTKTEETPMITEAARQGCTRSVWWVDGGTTSVKNLFAINHSSLGGGTLHYSLCDWCWKGWDAARCACPINSRFRIPVWKHGLRSCTNLRGLWWKTNCKDPQWKQRGEEGGTLRRAAGTLDGFKNILYVWWPQ